MVPVDPTSQAAMTQVGITGLEDHVLDLNASEKGNATRRDLSVFTMLIILTLDSVELI